MAAVVIIEDDSQSARMLATLLEFEGYQPVICSSPERVLDCVRETQPVAVVMDFYLGKQDARGLIRALREDPSLRRTGVIIISGADRAAEALGAGADAFLLKPFAVEDLLSLVRRFAQSPHEKERP